MPWKCSKGFLCLEFGDLFTIVEPGGNWSKLDLERMRILTSLYIASILVLQSLFEALNQTDIPHHFIRQLSDREQLVKEVQIIPIEVIVRKVAAGSICKRLGLKEGEPLAHTLIEFCLKEDSLGDPIISREHIEVMQLADEFEMDAMTSMAYRVTDFLTGLFSMMQIQLIDFKIEFKPPSTDKKIKRTFDL